MTWVNFPNEHAFLRIQTFFFFCSPKDHLSKLNKNLIRAAGSCVFFFLQVLLLCSSHSWPVPDEWIETLSLLRFCCNQRDLNFISII